MTIVLSFCPKSSMAQTIKDAESASHADTSAFYQIVETYSYSGFQVVQFNLAVLSHYSYMLVSNKQALVVDPGRDIYAYQEKAQKEGWEIKGVLLTHSHADFVAGHMELSIAMHCPIYVNTTSNVGYEHTAMKDGDTLPLEETMIKFVATPGHTPDSMCLYIYGKKSKDFPEVIFTGDTLFVGSLGRPDLLEGKMSAATLASMMFDTWNQKLASAGDTAVIFPAHGAGSLCGAHLSDKPFSTIGEQKVTNPYVQHKNRSDFIAAILEGLPEAPQYFKHNAAINKKGPKQIDWKSPLPEEVVAKQELTDESKYYVIDIRNAKEFADGHIPNSVNIGLRGRFETWTGIIVPWGSSVVLCANDEKEAQEAIYRLHRIGYKADFLFMESWKKSGLTVTKNTPIDSQELYRLMQKGEAPVIVDVRLPEEWMGMRIGMVVNLPLNHLGELSAKLDADQPVVTVCNSAYRSSMAVGILERKGFTKTTSLLGGSEAWIEAGLPVWKSEKKGTTVFDVPKREVKLADRISANDLKHLIMDLPGTFEIVDIRPKTAFAEFNLPGTQNVDIADLLSNPGYLVGNMPLIIVDRDGSLAMMVAGILSQKTQRNIKALYGGLEAYWTESELMPFISPEVKKEKEHVPQSNMPKIEIKTQDKSPVPPPAPAKKKSAGC